MDPSTQQNSQVSYRSNLTDMATGSISSLLQDNDIIKENQTIEQSFIRRSDYIQPKSIADGELIHHVTKAFTEVCRKIDNLHYIIERHGEEPSMIERKPGLDSIIIQEEKEEVGWLKKLKQIIYGKDEPEYTPEEDNEYNLSKNISAVNAMREERVPAENTLINALNSVEKAEMHAALSRQALKEEVSIQKTQNEKMSSAAEIAYQRTRAESAESALKEAKEQLASYRARLKIRKKEISEIKSSFTACAGVEASLARLATCASIQITRILLLLDMPDAIEQLHKEISAGETVKLTSSLQAIEGFFRERIQKEKETHEKTQKDKQHISNQLNALTKELEHLKEENHEIIKESEKIREEKDAIINKQRLAIKLLKSRFPQTSTHSNAHNESILAKSTHLTRADQSQKTKIKSKIEEELKERISDLKKKISKIETPNDPLYQRYLNDLEDSKRRLDDFMQI
ncbi:hypothetical protein NEPAR06_0961 [Nematocida parisii]|uniref:uncharacterized protein n=1 Tax=Nematocida parisii (strain ERTm1 / ATCC PRA-289) TaxID=881290 RepID=UPI000264B47F|nr:uncharacterized protein NEPG_00352 [Nematocida parisii ERTm1]EIJ94828.1 hypothetical protein NEPG_00352 [Nematocida parisii ERTm1]KAI5145319.1 hypothetical protein NEPAR07_1602 [Nematocida parisii]KAI5154228.1 hypothetical protein NEPAR06_0961 [Nematocida parisii]KAI5157830.1 hypothetical protein NEPAR05_1629 [Nematocida parisii]|eukprot:XP_013058184.1 hypothetical protein NEPG_00352 [Nematocida parisii ERTm1]